MFHHELPVELWEKILGYMDVLDLIKLRRVSKTFYHTTTVIIETECKWYKKCLTEIPETFWSSLLKHQNDSEISCKDFHKSKKHSPMWMAMYKSWKGWSALTEKTSSIKTFIIFEDTIEPCMNDCSTTFRQPSSSVLPEKLRIRGIDALYNTVAIVDATGRLMFYDISKPNDKPFIYQHQCEASGELCLCRKGNRIMTVASFMDEHENSAIQYWDVKSKELTREWTGEASMIMMNASYEFCCTVKKSHLHYFLNVERLGFGVVRSLVAPVGALHNIETIFMDGAKVMLITKNYPMDTSRIHTITEDHYVVRKIDSSYLPVRIFQFLNASVAVFVDRIAGLLVAFSVDGRDWKHYDARDDFDLSSSIVSVFYHVGHLIFGLVSGEVCIIHVGEIERAETFDSDMIKNAGRKTLKLDSEPIKFLKVTEFDDNQYIIAATKRKLHIITLN